MRHIDDMAHLREEVAFEGYAQKNPLVVYKEHAYEKFIRLMGEIAFRVTKGLLLVSTPPKVELHQEIPVEILQVTDMIGENSANTPVNHLLSNEAYEELGKHSGDGVRVYRKNP